MRIITLTKHGTMSSSEAAPQGDGAPEITGPIQMTVSRSLENGSLVTLILADGSVRFGLVVDPVRSG